MVVQGREVDEENVRWLSGWIGEHAGWSRRKLAGELCVLWDWRDGSGGLRHLVVRDLTALPRGTELFEVAHRGPNTNQSAHKAAMQA